METKAISIPLTRVYDCSLSDLVHVYNSLKSDGVTKPYDPEPAFLTN
jgi:hypothetical protein